jgi:hypothetical protein
VLRPSGSAARWQAKKYQNDNGIMEQHASTPMRLAQGESD